MVHMSTDRAHYSLSDQSVTGRVTLRNFVLPGTDADGDEPIFSDVQQIYVILEGREILSHEVMSDSPSGCRETLLPVRNETKFFAVKQVLAEFNEGMPLPHGVSSF